MDFLERDLEDIIFNADRSELRKRGLWILDHEVLKRQINLGAYGIADMVSIIYRRGPDDNKEFIITIYELKLKKISASSLMQAIRYAKGIERLILSTGMEGFEFTFRFVLIGKEFELGDFCYLPDFLGNVSAYTYSYGLNGILFEPMDNYRLDSPKFPKSSKPLILSVAKELLKNREDFFSKIKDLNP